MPKPGDRANAASDGRRRRRAPVVRGPQDLVFADQIPEGDAASIQRAAHTLKGSANLFFAKQVYDAAFRIEDNVRQKRFDGIESDYIRLRQCVQVLLKEIRQFLEITAE